MTRPSTDDPRKVAFDALLRISEQGAYANLVLPKAIARTSLSRRDRALATDLVYGTCRMQRACDWLVDRFVLRPVEPEVRVGLRLGAYQLVFLQTPAHAAVSRTVSLVPRRARGLANAVLRRVADDSPPPDNPDGWPDENTRLSYPDWIVERLIKDLGRDDAMGALTRMNEPPPVRARGDDYVQDLASQWVAEVVDGQPAERVADVCAAPGGKATAIASAHGSGGPWVAAGDVSRARSGLVATNAMRLGLRDRVAVVVADGTHPPWRAGTFDRVVVDAPCSGLGALRRRADARWRIEPDAVERLAVLQRQLVEAAVTLVRAGGVVVYSVCTLTVAETAAIDDALADSHSELRALPPPSPPWRSLGRGALLLPQAADTDGMYVLQLQRAP